MPFSPFDPVDEERSNTELEKAKQLLADAQAKVNPDVAKQVASIYKQAPYIPASVILSMAKAGTSQAALDALKPAAAKQAAADLDPQKTKQKSWFQRNVYDKAKSVSRWTFAGLQLVPDLVQNAAAEAFSPNDPAGMDGFFKSTQLGTMLSNSSEAGDGFFLGGKAAETQAQRAREFRGTINGHAWTIGRGAAELVFTPGSVAYNVMSGFVDAAVQIGADPSGKVFTKLRNVSVVDEALPGALRTAASRTARATIPGISTEAELSAAKLLAKGEAGLGSAEAKIFEQSKFGQFVTTDPRAKRLVERLVSVGSDSTASVEKRTRQILEEFNYSISPEIAREFAQADEIGKVHGLLGEASAKLANNPDDVLLPTDIREFRGARVKTKVFDDISERVPLFRNVRQSKWWNEIPKNTVIVNGTGVDRGRAIKNYSDYLIGIGIKKDSAKFDEVMDVVTKAYSPTGAGDTRAAVQNAFDKVFEVVAEEAGGNKKLAQVFAAKAREELAKARAYNVDEIGWADDGGFMQAMREVLPEEVFKNITPDVLDRIVLQGPGALVELMDEVQVLPDFRKMRTLMSNPFVRNALRTGEGEQRFAVMAAEFVQNEFWKPLALATGGYVMRNMMDAQTRIAMGGLKGAFNHPIDFIHWAMHKKGAVDIRGMSFEDVVGNTVKNWGREQEAYQEALTFNLYKNLEDSNLALEKSMRNGNFSLVNRGLDAKAHTTGYVDNLGMLHADPINQKLAQLRAEGIPARTRHKQVREWFKTPEGKKAEGRIREYFKTGIRYTDPETDKVGYIKLGDDVTDEALVQWVDKLSEFKIDSIVKGDDDLRVVVAHNRVPLTQVDETGRRTVVARVKIKENDFMPRDFLTGGDTPGNIVDLGDGSEGLIIAKRTAKKGEIDPFTGQAMEPQVVYTVQPVHKGAAFEGSLGSQALRDLIDLKGAENKLALVVKRAERGLPENPNVRQQFLAKKDKAVDFFFNNLYGTATQKLEKSPVFRQYYYREVLNNADGLSPQEAQNLIRNISELASREGMSMDDYAGIKGVIAKLKKVAFRTTTDKFVGDSEVLAKLEQVAAGAVVEGGATGTIEQLDQYAKMVALRRTKELLYNATERSNLEDVMRIIVPFGPAWKEVIGTYASNLIEDPMRIRRAQLLFDAGRKFDPDGDGQGFFYKDPTSGEYSFNFPMSGALSKLLTGGAVEAPLQAPVKRLSIGLSVIPSVGPVGQIVASKLIPDTPSTDFIASVILPYGRKEGIDLMPRWLSRFKEAVDANTTNLQTVYGNTYVETLRALAANGDYDLSQVSEQERLYADARMKARVIASLRALGSFIGPTSPSAEFKIETEQGDVYASALVKEFQRLQDPNLTGADGQPGNYDTAVERFINIFGNDAMIYLSNKTESVAGGLEATEQFADWQRNHKDLFKMYPDVAGFMAPGGDDFSFEAWNRQVRQGLRRRLSDKEIVAAAQYKIASAHYQALREKLPAKPSSEQKAWLRQWRVELNKQYPGFPAVSQFNPGEFPAKIQQLKNLVQEPSLQDNDVAQAVREYLDARDKALQSTAQGGYSSLQADAAAPVRDWLASIGQALKEETPEFARIYDRLLKNEVEE